MTSSSEKSERYTEILSRLHALVEGESDEIALMATMTCELHHGIPYFHWTGFYRLTEPGLLKIGPYQGAHGCLHIPLERGVCGKCAREGEAQVVEDVHALPYHIACSGSTRSEIVVPVKDRNGLVRAVLDVDSDDPAAFDAIDARFLGEICELLSNSFSTTDSQNSGSGENLKHSHS